jgi:hypothetical protein
MRACARAGVVGHLDASDSRPAVAAAGRAIGPATVDLRPEGPVATQLRSLGVGLERRIRVYLGLNETPAPQPVPSTGSRHHPGQQLSRRHARQDDRVHSSLAHLVLYIHQTVACDLRDISRALSQSGCTGVCGWHVWQKPARRTMMRLAITSGSRSPRQSSNSRRADLASCSPKGCP